MVALAALVTGCTAPAPAPVLTVGTTSDPTMLLLANVYAAGLRYYGTAATVETSADPVVALDDGTVGVVPGFTGRLLKRFAPDSTARSAAQVYRAMVGALPEGVAAGDYAVAAEDKAALAVTEMTAATLGSRDLVALVDNCSRVRVGARTGSPALDVVGDCTLAPPREFGTAEILFDALRSGTVTAVWTTTADRGIPADAVVLVDRKPTLITAQNVVALFRRNEFTEMQLRAINEIAGVLDTAALVDMLDQVAAGTDARDVADGWLAANPLGR
ncbi:MAG: glycine betaine ABC transporter substrate-binding protein [Mycobacterium sp.]